MSSSVSSSLSPGAQLLAHNQHVLPSSSQTEAGKTAGDQGVKKAAGAAPVQAGSVVSGSITSADGDTVELSAEAMQMLQQMGGSGEGGSSYSHAAHAYSGAAAHESFDYFG